MQIVNSISRILFHSILRNSFGFLISGVLLWLTFKKSGLSFNDIYFKENQWLYFVGAIIAFVFSNWIQSIRLKLLWIKDAPSVSVLDGFKSIVIGNFYNCLLPGNLGEGVRVLYFSRKKNVSISKSLAALITEKWIDGQMFIGLAVVLFALRSYTGHYIQSAILFTAVAVGVLWIAYIFMRNIKAFEKRMWSIVNFFIGKIGLFFYKLYRYVIRQIDNLKVQKVMGNYFLLCLVAFAFNILQFYFVLGAAGVPPPVQGIYTSFLVASSMMIIAFIPSAPGNIGVLHYGLYAVLSLSAEQTGVIADASAKVNYARFGVLVHLSFFIPEVLLGAWCVLKEHKLLFKIK